MFAPHDNLFHYTNARTFLDHILTSRTLRMGPYKGVNDPREARDWRFTVYLRGPDAQSKFSVDLVQKLSDEITNKTLVMCFSMDRPERADRHDHRNSGYGHPRMWAQYGHNHAGVCLVLEKGALQSAVEKALGSQGLYYGPVEYHRAIPERGQNSVIYLEDMLAMGPEAFMAQHTERFHQSLFFTKHDDWRDETEFRWVFRSPTGEAVFIPILDCLKAVIIGPYADSGEVTEIVHRCSEAGIESCKMFYLGGEIELVPQPPPRDILILNGISFSTEVPCHGVFASAHNAHGRQVPIYIDPDGNVGVFAPDGHDVDLNR